MVWTLTIDSLNFFLNIRLSLKNLNCLSLPPRLELQIKLRRIHLSCCYEFFLNSSSASLVWLSIESLCARSLNFGIPAIDGWQMYTEKNLEGLTVERVHLFQE